MIGSSSVCNRTIGTRGLLDTLGSAPRAEVNKARTHMHFHLTSLSPHQAWWTRTCVIHAKEPFHIVVVEFIPYRGSNNHWM